MTALTRRLYIEQFRRLIYNGQPSADATITVNLVNQVLNQAIGFAAKKNYTDNLTIEGISFVNNSFYTIYKGLTITADENFTYKVTLPHVPFGLGYTEGVETMVIKDNTSTQISYPIVWLTQNQVSYVRSMRTIPNKILAYTQGTYVYLITTLLLSMYTAQVTMVSGGDSSDLDSVLNVPADYLPVITDYLYKYFMEERSVPIDNVNDGVDAFKQV